MLNVEREAIDSACAALRSAMSQCRNSGGLRVLPPSMDDALVEATVLGAMMILGAQARWFVKPSDIHFIVDQKTEDNDAA